MAPQGEAETAWKACWNSAGRLLAAGCCGVSVEEVESVGLLADEDGVVVGDSVWIGEER